MYACAQLLGSSTTYDHRKNATLLDLFNVFYRCGSLVYGGGQVGDLLGHLEGGASAVQQDSGVRPCLPRHACNLVGSKSEG